MVTTFRGRARGRYGRIAASSRRPSAEDRHKRCARAAGFRAQGRGTVSGTAQALEAGSVERVRPPLSVARITAEGWTARAARPAPRRRGRRRGSSTLRGLAVSALLIAASVSAEEGGRPPIRLVLPGPGAADTASSGRATGLDRLLTAELASVAPGVAYSPRLARAAEALAAAVAEVDASALPVPFVESALHWVGAPHLSPRVTLMATSEDSRTDLWQEVASRLAADPPSKQTEIGIGRVPGDGVPFRWRWAFVLAELKADLDAFPRQLEPGGLARLVFRLRDGLEQPRIVVTSVAGHHSRRTPSRDGGGWAAELQMGLESGQQWIEILADGPRGPEVAALFPVWVGRDPPHEWRGTAGSDERWIVEPWQAELVLLELLNDARSRAGLQALIADPELGAIARSHSDDMVQRRYFAHIGSDGGGLAERLARAGITIFQSAENLARSPTVHEAHASLLRSPGHAENIYTTTMDRVGMGVAFGSDPEGHRVVLVTQVFARRRVAD